MTSGHGFSHLDRQSLDVDLESKFHVDAELIHLTVLDGSGLLVDVNRTNVANGLGGVFHGVLDRVFVAFATFAKDFDYFKDFAHNKDKFVGDRRNWPQPGFTNEKFRAVKKHRRGRGASRF